MTYVKKIENIGKRINMIFESKEAMKKWHRAMSNRYDPNICMIASWYNLDTRQYEGMVTYFKKGEPHYIEATE